MTASFYYHSNFSAPPRVQSTMKRAAGLAFLGVLAFGGAGPLRFRVPGPGPAILAVDPDHARALVVDGVRFPAHPFGTEVELPSGAHHLTLETLHGSGFMTWVDPIDADVRVEAGRRYQARWVLVREMSMWQTRVRLEPYDLPVSGPQSASGTGMTESRPMRTSAKSL